MQYVQLLCNAIYYSVYGERSGAFGFFRLLREHYFQPDRYREFSLLLLPTIFSDERYAG